MFSFQFLLICILPRFIQWTYCPQTLKEVTYSIYIQCWSWSWLHFKIIFTLLKKERKLFLRFCLSIFCFQKSWKNINPNQEYWLSCFNPPSQGNPKARNMEESVRETTVFSQWRNFVNCPWELFLKICKASGTNSKKIAQIWVLLLAIDFWWCVLFCQLIIENTIISNIIIGLNNIVVNSMQWWVYYGGWWRVST